MEEELEKILIITYYWPPLGGVGVHRWLRFSKYLADNGLEPIIFTPEDPQFTIEDNKLGEAIDHRIDVLRFPIWEPFRLFNKLSGKSNKGSIQQGLLMEKSKPGMFDRLVVWLRGNLFIPDPRIFWVRPATNFLKDYLTKNQVSWVITTGPPHSMHLIGHRLRKATGVKWLADFRDPWSSWDLLHNMGTTALAHRVHKRLEKKVLRGANKVTTVSPRLASHLSDLAGRKVLEIRNGVASSQVPEEAKITDTLPFRIGYFGMLNEIRYPEEFFSSINSMLEQQEVNAADISILLAGIISERIKSDIAVRQPLKKIVRYEPYISNSEIFSYYQSCDLLLLLLNRTENASWILPMKLFEYLAAGRPVLMLGERESDAADLIEKSGGGVILDYEDKIGIKNFLISAIDKKRAGDWSSYRVNNSFFEMESQGKKLLEIIS